ncbi:MAG TPA: hypothetical protein VFX46_06500 [Hyphomicrobiaceae bacterium]|nr:hypothetical protein [Hyphomicrobiaceae bacterium]
MSNAQRALWTFLFYTLVGPFIGSLLLSVAIPLALVAGFLPDLADLESGGRISFTGWAALYAYVWGAPTAALAALGLLPFVFRGGTFSWIAAAVAGVIAFGVTTIFAPLPVPGTAPYLAFLAGVVSLICWAVLSKMGVLAGADE